ncbi:MAG TPA: TonB-dependent receptor [Rhizomicrobium sp.]|jgi:iron complex outermembrane receptor protein|nr:TonB-dependent receptor [Rhizomicrobium sp.]
MNRSNRRTRGFAKWLLAGSALTALTVGITPAFADEQMETVVVTARQRAEDIHDVPSQDTAFTADQILAKGIESPADFLNSVPNVTFVSTQNAGTSFIVMRGIGQSRNSEPSAAIVVDGVPMTQPAQFNQELVDIQQIEVVKGPQGALYGRNAIGGAILITTAQPTDEWQARFTGGYESGPGYKMQGMVSGPITDDLKVRVSISDTGSDGHLRNEDTTDQSARRDADPVQDFNARVSALYTPTSDLTFDLRLSMDDLDTRGLYFIVPPLGSPEFNNPNFVSQPIDLNNSGFDKRKIYDASLKASYETSLGTLSSITGYNTVWEILTGDGYTFDPHGQSKIFFDFDQSQFLDTRTFTQELRFTSKTDGRFHWIAGGQMFYTQRFISTGNMFDIADEGVVPVFRHPTSAPGAFQPQGQISYLADGQNQIAWAAYLDTSTEITDSLELSLNARFDSDHRVNTTLTPDAFLHAALIPGAEGDKRSHTWSAFQPQAVLRWAVNDDINLYASYGRGFRSGGFNQTGVAQAAAAAGFDNVGDQFKAEVATTFEVGAKTRWFDDRLNVDASVYTTNDHNAYYFVFLASNSTQNLGNIPEVRLSGFDIDATAHITDDLSANVGFGYTDSDITKFNGPSAPLVIGSKAPLVSDYTLNVGLQYEHKVWDGWKGQIRLDDNLIGPTTFVIPVPAVNEPTPIARDPVNLVNLRLSLLTDDSGWQGTLWSKNLLDKKYNSEYSTGGFLFKGEPMSWGFDVTKRF